MRDDELDNLLRDHLAGELDAVRGQARRAFEREVTRPMQLRLRQRAWTQIQARIRHAAPIALSMAACAALGFYVPRFLTGPGNSSAANEAVPASVAQIADADLGHTLTRREDHQPITLPDGTNGRRVVASQVESASWIDPQTKARTEVYLFPVEQEVIQQTGRQ
jgi:hypothetical protein